MKDKEEIDAYLARIRRTIAESDALVGQAELRLAETDRLLEKQGLTRESLRAIRFTPQQVEAANRELSRHGLPPIEEEPPAAHEPAGEPAAPFAPPPPPVAEDGSELAARRMKFSMMMKPFRL